MTTDTPEVVEPFKPFVLAQGVVAKTGDELIDMMSKHHTFYIVHPTNRKVLTTTSLAEEGVDVLLHRLNGQHTANCLVMQNIDVSSPFHAFGDFTRGLTTKVKEEFEDSLMTVYKQHQVMAQNGYYLWYSAVEIGNNTVTVNNQYVAKPVETEENKGRRREKLECVELRAFVHLETVTDIGQLHKLPGSFWLTSKDHETSRLAAAAGYAVMREGEKPSMQLVVTAQGTGVQPKRRPIPNRLNSAIERAFDVHHVYSHVITSRPGTVNSIHEYQCSDSLGNPIQVNVITNMG